MRLAGVLNGAITALVSAMMSIRSKTFEIGVLRAHGLRDSEVLQIPAFPTLGDRGYSNLSLDGAGSAVEPPSGGAR